MQSIKIKELRLENFKNHKLFVLSPNGANATVYGDNATGKTSIYDALTWLLFGKDSLGNGEKNIEIKPLNDAGEVADHEAITAVEAVLTVGGEEITLRRTYQEVWTTKRGSAEATYDGNTSEYYVDGVPVKKYAFQDKVNSIVDADTFLMLTSVSYFASDLPWQKRREKLFEITGVMDDKQIMATRDMFAPLLGACGKLTLAEYKAKLLSEKKGYVGARNEIPARINECQKTVEDLMGLDFQGAKAEVAVLQGRADRLSGELIAIERNTAADGKKMELREAQMELEKLENENRAYRNSQVKPKPDTSALENALKWAKSKAGDARDRVRLGEEQIAKLELAIAGDREAWMKVNSEVFAASGKCPTCGQNLPADQMRAAKERFEADKANRLRSLEDSASDRKRDKALHEEAVAQANREIEAAEKEAVSIQEQIAKLEAGYTPATVTDMEDYQSRQTGIQKWITGLQDELHKLSQDSFSAGEGIRKELAEVKAQIVEKNAVIGKESTLEYARERIEKLRQEAKEGAEKLAKVEQMLFLMDEFSRYKTGFVEDSVSRAFRIARFRLFLEQANGGVEDRCDVVCGGVPYMNLNNGAKINVGIDIINTLSNAYGVRVPLFVDNAESVTRLEGSDTQIIRLVVSENDKELRVNYEN